MSGKLGIRRPSPALAGYVVDLGDLGGPLAPLAGLEPVDVVERAREAFQKAGFLR